MRVPQCGGWVAGSGAGAREGAQVLVTDGGRGKSKGETVEQGFASFLCVSARQTGKEIP